MSNKVNNEKSKSAKLKRSITLPFLILYGVGTMVGGGFYALIGKVAGEAGLFAPIAFLCAGLLAFISATSFAELSSRLPFSAGEARYVKEGFHSNKFSITVGWLVIFTGIISAATLAVASIGFLQDLIPVPEKLSIGLLVLAMGLVAGWGIGKSVGLVTTITIIEVGALFYVVFIAGDSLGQLPQRWHEVLAPTSGIAWLGIFSGAFLGFYAFLGFEDMVNMAEEVKDVRRNLPIAILVSIVLTTLIYVVVVLVAILTVSPETLASSNTPIAEIVRGHGWFSVSGLGIVSILTGLNGALVQIIMAARVAYGMAKRNQAPGWLGVISSKTQTPLRATAIMSGVVLLLALFFPMTSLAKATSSVILVVFAIVNLALWLIKGDKNRVDEHGIRFPRWLSLLGFLTCVSVLLFQAWQIVCAG
ncbi:MAG: APC family permease [Pseudomonadota bacterium]|nr:APC family permease [Pseudomonadota bacterium]